MPWYSYFTVSAKMKRRGQETSGTTRKDNTSSDEPNRKSYTLRKRKYGTEENDPGELNYFDNLNWEFCFTLQKKIKHKTLSDMKMLKIPISDYHIDNDKHVFI
jgi:hypothetical protein